jgi:amino acid transporter
VSGVVATLALVAALRIGDGSVATAFNVVIGIVLLFTTLSYIVIFPSVIKLRLSHAHAHRPYRIPGGKVGVWVAGCLTTMWAVLASLAGIFPGMLSNGQLLDDSALPEGVSRGVFTSYALGAIGITLAVGIWFYALGAKVRRQLVVDPEVPVEPPPHTHA